MNEEWVLCFEGVPSPQVVGADNTYIWSPLASLLDNGLILFFAVPVVLSYVEAVTLVLINRTEI